MIGHPERSLPRFLRQTESKDLHLFFNELQTHHASGYSLSLKQVDRLRKVSYPDVLCQRLVLALEG
jgi:hypothetical protein